MAITNTFNGSQWLVVVDMQRIFERPDSPWATPGIQEIVEPIQRLIRWAAPQVCFTRFLAPVHPEGAWQAYYRDWPFALQPEDSPDYVLMDAFREVEGIRIDATTFSKWTPAMQALLKPGHRMILAGVSTDCCVLSTALAAADGGVYVDVVADACRGVNEESHRRALDVMALYRPQIRIVTVNEILGEPS
ncbi:MAG: cysteine hydrolase [Firmicutes bacterium]|nr:cysteine hydrolase [Bacillota bacterium]